MSDVTGGSSVQSSLANLQPKVFSLVDEKSVVILLRHVHQSPLNPDDKNELRDAIFAFRNSPETEPSETMMTLFAEHGFPLSSNANTETLDDTVPVPAAPKPVAQFGTTRPSPQFSKVSVTIPPSAFAAESKQEVAKDVPAIPVAESLATPVHEVAPASIVTPEPVVEPAPTEIPPVPTAAPVEETVTAPKLVADTAGALERIKEIKKEVNLLVGNPVNLIDVHNEVGREYMNALLDAMKKNNGGTPEQVDRAMMRLEIAFTSVKQTVGVSGDDALDEGAQPVVPTPAPSESEVAEPPTPTVSDTVAEPVIPASVAPITPEREEQPAKDEPVVSGFASVHQTHVEEPGVTSVPAPVPEVEELEGTSVVEPVAPIVPPQEPLVPVPSAVEQKSPALTSGGILSVAKEKQIQHLMNAEKQQAATTDQQRNAAEIAKMDPLMTPDVTNGLQQLLSEWSLFKSSGIFGTGPSGMEHHLFKKLATLNMTAVVAGRFEGATPEIKRSITDYMNGWRYEEGIMQEQGELFEHYLRRVIKHILDKRK